MSIRFAAIGFAHGHIYNMVNVLQDVGAELVTFYESDSDLSATFQRRHPHVLRAASIAQILEDETIDLVVSAAIPNGRAALGIAVMQHGKDFLCAKPGMTTLQQLQDVREVQAETQCKYMIYYGERLQSPATVKAGELVQAGAIGQVVQTVGFGPHRLLGQFPRPDWEFDRQYFGGILNSLASHQMDQFLFFTGSTEAEVITAQVGNVKHEQFPDMHDFGDVVVRSPTATGYVRVDWLTPQGLSTWGDVRLFILGTEGTLELRKNIDIAGRPGNNHLFMVNQDAPTYIDCSNHDIPFARDFIADIQKRTETAMLQAHCFLAAELALRAELKALEFNV